MATNSEWGLTERGFRRPTYTELLDAMEYKARELFGNKVNLTVRSPLGIFLRIFTWVLDILFALIEDVYNSRFVDTAVGTSLYNLGRAIGLKVLNAQKATGYLEVTGIEGSIVPSGWLASNIEGIQFVVVGSGKIDSTGKAVVAARAVIAGPDGNVGANTITTIVNPNTPVGLFVVTNPKAFDSGRDHETYEEYRDRYYKSVDFAGGVNADAIRAEILQNAEGVYSALVYENDTDFHNSIGLPPHSIEAIVYGGLYTDIATCIFRRKAAGIQTYGNTTIPVISKSGQAIDICFSRPALVPIWVRIENLSIDATQFPADGEEQIRQALINYIGCEAYGGLAIGEPVYCKRLTGNVYSVSGVLDFEVAISLDGEAYDTTKIVIGPREKAVLDESKVSIV